jgi:aspartate-semialdehyde dehydrogenase
MSEGLTTGRGEAHFPVRKIDVAVLGATGSVGQQFVALLANHPWFCLASVMASERSAGALYGELPWRLPTPLPNEIGRLRVEPAKPGVGPQLVFSALDSTVAGEVEAEFAVAGHVVVSNARNHRLDPLTPLLIPEVNADHLRLLPLQREKKNRKGAIVTNPNCATIGLAIPLAALRAFRPKRVVVTTLQALSGAGYPGVASLDATANVIPFIDGEEAKMEFETKKILGKYSGNGIEPDTVTISATATRVPVLHGHTESVSVELEEKVEASEILTAFRNFSGRPQKLRLPSAPTRPIVYLDQQDRPQPRIDSDRDGGMGITVGRLRRCPVLGHKFVLLSHNLVRGAAGAAILNAELMLADGYLS